MPLIHDFDLAGSSPRATRGSRRCSIAHSATARPKWKCWRRSNGRARSFRAICSTRRAEPSPHGSPLLTGRSLTARWTTPAGRRRDLPRCLLRGDRDRGGVLSPGDCGAHARLADADGSRPSCPEEAPPGTPVSTVLETSGDKSRVIVLDALWQWSEKCETVASIRSGCQPPRSARTIRRARALSTVRSVPGKPQRLFCVLGDRFDAGHGVLVGSGDTLTRSFPKLEPSNSFRNAVGVFSRPSTMSSLYLMLPFTQAAPHALEVGGTVDMIQTMKPLISARLTSSGRRLGAGRGSVAL